MSRTLPRAKPRNRRMNCAGLSSGIEVEEPRRRVQFLFQNEHSLVLDDVADFAVLIEQVAEFPGAHRAYLDARRIAPRAGPLDAEGALLHNALGPRPVAQVVGVGVDLGFRDFGLGPVEVPGAVGTGRHAVPAADAPVVVDHHDPIFFRPGGAGRAYLGAGRVAALLALDRDVEMPLLGDLGGRVVGVGGGEIDALVFLHREHLDPLNLRIARLVVLRHACVAENNQSRNPQIQWIKVLSMEKDKGVDFSAADPYYAPAEAPEEGHF